MKAQWKRFALGEVIEIASGQVDPRETPYCDMIHVGGDNIESHTGKLHNLRTAGEQSLISGKYLFDEHDVLYSKIRPVLNKVVAPDFKGVCSADIYPLRPSNGKVCKEFLVHLLRSNDFLAYTTACSSRTNIPKINRDALFAYQALLPPLQEQQRIAAILDKTDAIRRKREEGIRLTEELLRSTFLEMFGDPVINERRWHQAPLGELLTSIENGWSPKCLDRPVEEDEWGVLKLGSVTYCKYRPFENKALPPTETHHPKIEVRRGDLLLTRKNTYDLVAACAYVFETPPRLMLPDLIFRLCIKDRGRVLPEFLWGLLTHPGKRKGIQALAGGSAGSMPNISKAKLLGHSIEVPPIEKQQKFADIMHRLHEIEQKRRAQQADQEVLLQTLVQRAFRGEL